MEDGVHHGDLTARCAGCLSRRAFLAEAGLAAATAAFLAACGDGQIGGGGPTGPVSAVTVKVSDFPDLATVGKLTNINTQIAAKRTGAATFEAFSRSCTHEGTTVVLFQSGFFCPNHGSQFDNNGHVTVGPATRDLPTLNAVYDATTDSLSIG
jgi:cytochrome b6-f complex iron-sulfur subunit